MQKGKLDFIMIVIILSFLSLTKGDDANTKPKV